MKEIHICVKESNDQFLDGMVLNRMFDLAINIKIIWNKENKVNIKNQHKNRLTRSVVHWSKAKYIFLCNLSQVHVCLPYFCNPPSIFRTM